MAVPKALLVPLVAGAAALAACGNAGQASVARATAAVKHVTAGDDCPKTVQFRGEITATSAGDAVYRWERSDGTTEPRHTVHFAGRGTASVAMTWTLRESHRAWARLHVVEPRDLRSPRAFFSVECRARILAATVAVSPTVSARCNETFAFIGRVAVSGPATVTYEWQRSDGTRSPRSKLAVPSAGTAAVRHSWTIGPRSYSGWVRLVVVGTGSAASNKAAFRKTLPCR